MDTGLYAHVPQLRAMGSLHYAILFLAHAVSSCKGKTVTPDEVPPQEETVLPVPMRVLSIGSLTESSAYLSWKDDPHYFGDSARYFYRIYSGIREDTLRLAAQLRLDSTSLCIQGVHYEGLRYFFRVEKWFAGKTTTQKVTFAAENETLFTWNYSAPGNTAASMIEWSKSVPANYLPLDTVPGSIWQRGIEGCVLANTRLFFRIKEFTSGVVGSYSNVVIKEFFYNPIKNLAISGISENAVTCTWRLDGGNTRYLYVQLNKNDMVLAADSVPAGMLSCTLHTGLLADSNYSVTVFPRSGYNRSKDIVGLLKYVFVQVKLPNIANVTDSSTEVIWQLVGTQSRKIVLSFSPRSNVTELVDTVPVSPAWYRIDRLFHPDTFLPNQFGMLNPNELGVFDMGSNVIEGCSNYYNATYYSTSPVANPQGPVSGSCKVLRCGSFSLPAGPCTVTRRSWANPIDTTWDAGLRLVGNVKQ